MTTLPTPFVVGFLLLLLAASNHHRLKQTQTGLVFAAVLYINAFSMALIGLRWSLDMVTLLPLAATLAIASSALLYLGFCSLGRRGPVLVWSRDWVHLVPVLLVAVIALILPMWVDIPLIVAKTLYAGLLVHLARQIPDSLQFVRLSWLKNSHQALWGAAMLLLFSIVLDIAITIDFIRYQGRHAADLVGFSSLLILLLLGWVSVLAGRGRVIEPAEGSLTDANTYARTNEDISSAQVVPAYSDTVLAANANSSDTDFPRLLEKLNKLLVDDRLFADTELNLQRLARKAGVPSRTISRVINAQTGLNMSQWVNCARVDAVCALLKDDSVTVSDAMFEAGFVTKSNFNREFKRIKGCSPSDWRAANASAAE